MLDCVIQQKWGKMVTGKSEDPNIFFAKERKQGDQKWGQKGKREEGGKRKKKHKQT